MPSPSITNIFAVTLCGLAATVLAQNAQASTLEGINHTHWAINHWETGAGSSKGFPGTGDWPKYLAWEKKIDAQKRQHSKVVPVPDYTGQKVCGITVHFLPCDELQVSTSCYAYGSPEYPIKTPLQLPEPQSCPQ